MFETEHPGRLSLGNHRGESHKGRSRIDTSQPTVLASDWTRAKSVKSGCRWGTRTCVRVNHLDKVVPWSLSTVVTTGQTKSGTDPTLVFGCGQAMMMMVMVMMMMMMMTPPWCLIAVRLAESRLGKHQFAKFHNGKKVKHLEAEKLNC